MGFLATDFCNTTERSSIFHWEEAQQEMETLSKPKYNHNKHLGVIIHIKYLTALSDNKYEIILEGVSHPQEVVIIQNFIEYFLHYYCQEGESQSSSIALGPSHTQSEQKQEDTLNIYENSDENENENPNPDDEIDDDLFIGSDDEDEDLFVGSDEEDENEDNGMDINNESTTVSSKSEQPEGLSLSEIMQDNTTTAATAKPSAYSDTDFFHTTSSEKSSALLDRLRTYDPTLFDDTLYKNKYATTCQTFRQPIVIRSEEKAQIDQLFPNAYTPPKGGKNSFDCTEKSVQTYLTNTSKKPQKTLKKRKQYRVEVFTMEKILTIKIGTFAQYHTIHGRNK